MKARTPSRSAAGRRLAAALGAALATCGFLGACEEDAPLVVDAGGGAGAEKAPPFLDDALWEALANEEEAALERLSAQGAEVAAPVLDALGDEEPRRRKAAAFATRAFPGGGRAVGLALALDKEKDPDVVAALVRSLGASGDPQALGALLGALDRDDTRLVVLHELPAWKGRLGGQEAGLTAKVIPIAEKGEEPARRAAVAVLAAWTPPQGSAAMHRLAAGQGTPPVEPETQVLALQSVGAFHEPAPLKTAVGKALTSKNDDVRYEAVLAAGELDKKVRKQLLAKVAKKDPVPAIRKRAKEIIEHGSTVPKAGGAASSTTAKADEAPPASRGKAGARARGGTKSSKKGKAKGKRGKRRRG